MGSGDARSDSQVTRLYHPNHRKPPYSHQTLHPQHHSSAVNCLTWHGVSQRRLPTQTCIIRSATCQRMLADGGIRLRQARHRSRMAQSAQSLHGDHEGQRGPTVSTQQVGFGGDAVFQLEGSVRPHQVSRGAERRSQHWSRIGLTVCTVGRRTSNPGARRCQKAGTWKRTTNNYRWLLVDEGRLTAPPNTCKC